MKKVISYILLVIWGVITIIMGSFIGILITKSKIGIVRLSDIDTSNWEIPIIEINTQNGIVPQDKENYINCSFSISNTKSQDDSFYLSMKSSYGDEDSVGIRLRGNSTLSQEKKPYRIKFENKKSLLGLHEAKSWVLLAEYFDASKIRNYTALMLGNKVFSNLGFTPTPNHVVLAINGEIKGIYVLTEQIDENEGRTNVEADFEISNLGQNYDFPFLIEIGCSDYIENVNGFYVENLGHVEIKYPDFDENNIEDNLVVFDYINEYVKAIFYLINNGGTMNVSFRENLVTLNDLIDEDSMIDYYILNEFMCNRDASHCSIYINKNMTSTATMGPVWDFDTATYLSYDYDKTEYPNIENKICIAYNSEIFNAYLANEENYKKVQNRYFEVYNDIVKFIDSLSQYKKHIFEPVIVDSKIWNNGSARRFSVEYDAEQMFFYKRINYLTKVFQMDYLEFWEEIEQNHLLY